MTTIQRQVEFIKATLAGRDTISLEAGEKLLAILDAASPAALEILYRERVKFAWMPARNRLQGKFGYVASDLARIDRKSQPQPIAPRKDDWMVYVR